MKSNEPSESCPADRSNDRPPYSNTASAAPVTEVGAKLMGRPKPLSADAAESLDADPFWVPPGLEIDGWSPTLRTEIATLINPIYRELVLLARPGLAQSTGLTIVHLMWLEILDQIEIARAEQVPDSSKDPLRLAALVSGVESRKEMIERHLRLVHAKFKASNFLLRLQEFKARCRSEKKRPLDVHYRNLSALPRPPRKPGENDFR